MAEAIGAAIISAIGAEVAAGSAAAALGVEAAAVSAVVGNVVITGAAIGASVVLQALNAPKPRNETQQATLNQAMAARQRIYGRTMVGGIRSFWSARNGSLFQDIVLASDQIDGIEQYWVGDRAMTMSDGVNGGFVQDIPMTNLIFFEPHLGTDTQAASGILLSYFSSDNIWTPAHQLKGIAHVVAVFVGVKKEDQQTVYPQGYVTPLRFVVRGARVWNPSDTNQSDGNKATWAYSESSALCILDYLRHKDGLRFATSNIDIPSFQAFHALCTETVSRKDGSTEPRYRIGGTYALNEAPKDVLSRMCATCDGTIVRGPTGKIGIRGGKYKSPLVNIASNIILSGELTQGNDRLDAYNHLKITYTDPDNFYQPTELQARDDTASQAALGQIDHAIDLVMVPSWTQAARLAKIRFAKDNPLWKGSFETRLSALNAFDQETVQVAFDPIPLAGGTPFMNAACSLTSLALKGDLTGCDLGITSISADAYSWNPAVDEPPRPALPQIVHYINDVAAPQNVTVAASRRNVSGGSQVVFAILSWSASGRTDVIAEAETRLTGGTDSDWRAMSVRGDGLSAEVGPLTDGATYDFHVRYVAGSTASEWSNIVTLAVVADNVAPAQPTLNSATRTSGTNTVIATGTAPDSANTRQLQFFRANGFDKGGADAVQVGLRNATANQQISFSDTADLGFLRYYLKALNGSGVASAADGPQGNILVSRPLTQKLTSPDDFTNAAWVKTRLTAALSGGNAPDGAAWSLLSETATTGSHIVNQSQSITSGDKLRFAFMVKAAGRTKGRIQLTAPDGSLAFAIFNLSAGTISAITSAGASVTGATPNLIRISADSFLATLTATLAAASITSQINVLDDTLTLSYAGDTTKGLYIAGATLGVVT